MIYGSIKNANLYFGIHRDTKNGLKYLAKLNPDIKLDEYRISKNIKAIVNEYWTVEYLKRVMKRIKKLLIYTIQLLVVNELNGYFWKIWEKIYLMIK